MDKFKILYDRLTNLSDTYKSDKKIINDIASVKTYVTTQEKYYNLIPINIRTTSTLHKIITNLSHKIDQITHVPQQNYVTVNPNYEEDTVSDANCDTITLAYLTQQTINAADKTDSDAKINALQNNLVLQQTAAAKQIQDLQALQAANNIDKITATKQIQDLQDLQAANDIDKINSDANIQSLQNQLQEQQITNTKQIQDLEKLQSTNITDKITSDANIQELQNRLEEQQIATAKQIQDLVDLQLANNAERTVTAKQIQDLEELQTTNNNLQQSTQQKLDQQEIINKQELLEQKKKYTNDCDEKIKQQLEKQKETDEQKLYYQKTQDDLACDKKLKLQLRDYTFDKPEQITLHNFTNKLDVLKDRYLALIVNINSKTISSSELITKLYELNILQTAIQNLKIALEKIPNGKEKNIQLRINDLIQKIAYNILVVKNHIQENEIKTGAGPDAQSEESYCNIM